MGVKYPNVNTDHEEPKSYKWAPKNFAGVFSKIPKKENSCVLR